MMENSARRCYYERAQGQNPRAAAIRSRSPIPTGPRTANRFIVGGFPQYFDSKGAAMLRRVTATTSSWVPVPLRLALGTAFIGHGAQKVLGSFNGPGFAKFTSFPAPFPFMRPAWLWMGAAAVSEFIGGILVLLGLFTRAGAFLIT